MNPEQVVGTGVKVEFKWKNGQTYRGQFLRKDVETMSDVFVHENGIVEKIPWDNQGLIENLKVVFPVQDTKTKRYVVGFLFDGAGNVVLIQKNRPQWQAGLLNGPGGKIEDGEFPAEAMRREFKEETGVDIAVDRWRLFATLRGEGVEVWCFTCVRNANLQQLTDERVGWYNAFICFDPSVVQSLHWLIPMAMDPGCPKLLAVVDNVAR